MKKNILIITQDTELYHGLRDILQTLSPDIFLAKSGNTALNRFADSSCCLAVISTLFPFTLELISRLRSVSKAPILILGTDIGVDGWCAYLTAGATAYAELTPTLQACALQAKSLVDIYRPYDIGQHNKVILCGTGLIIDPFYHTVIYKENTLNLTKQEFSLLYFLASHKMQVFTREQIYQQAWGNHADFGVDEAVKSCIKSLRKKLLVTGKEYIQNVHGVGYRFVND